MAAWGYEFYLLVLKVEDKILIPKRPRSILCVCINPSLVAVICCQTIYC